MPISTVGKSVISLETAQELVASALRYADKTERRVSVAVVDPAGNLIAFGRDDAAQIVSANVAIDKAYSAAITGKATHDWQTTVEEDKPLGRGLPYGVDRLIVFGGGQLIQHQGHTIGAIGVSGSHWSGDREIGRVALDEAGFDAEEA